MTGAYDTASAARDREPGKSRSVQAQACEEDDLLGKMWGSIIDRFADHVVPDAAAPHGRCRARPNVSPDARKSGLDALGVVRGPGS